MYSANYLIEEFDRYHELPWCMSTIPFTAVSREIHSIEGPRKTGMCETHILGRLREPEGIWPPPARHLISSVPSSAIDLIMGDGPNLGSITSACQGIDSLAKGPSTPRQMRTSHLQNISDKESHQLSQIPTL